MSGRGRHRPQPNRRISRRISRVSLAAAAGGAGLIIPLIGAGHAQAATPGTSGGSQVSQAHPDSYSVVPGDSLASIARAKHVAGGWHKLYNANRKTVGDNPNLIRPGEKLTVPTGNAAAEKQGGSGAKADNTADRSNTGGQGAAAGDQVSQKTYANNLDGWIRQSLDIMKAHNIPGSYDGIKRNIMRESGGNPNIVNNWDINAQKGTPSKGLLQVIAPTFAQYHVQGTANNMTDPVANIVAACNYAAAQYGSIDNVNGPY
jgi:LysM repeat protein